ncbi:MAG: hypothetical protein WC374_06400 [Phycisphaerae bacterium]|jgi:hypothetical protein
MPISKATSFGALTDHFSLLTGALADIAVLVASSKVPRAQARADAMDANEDIAASAYSGNSSEAIFEASCTYALKSGTLDISDLVIGELAAQVFAESLELTTANGGWPQITVAGYLGLQTIVAPSGYTNQYTLPAISVLGMKQAQLLGFTVTTGRLTGSKIGFKCTMAEQLDGVGEPAAHGVSGGTGDLTADFVRIDSAPTWALAAVLADSGAGAVFMAEVTQDPGAEEGQAAWHTSSGAAAFQIPRLASA